MKVRIYTHRKPRHLDDALAVGILIAKLRKEGIEDIEIVEILPKEVESHIEEPNSYFVDIGGRYEPPRYLDHHHSSEIESSFLLALKEYDSKLYEFSKTLREVQFIDIKDRYGAVEALNRLGINSYQMGVLEALALGIIQNCSKLEDFEFVGKSFIEWLENEFRKKEMLRKTKVVTIGSIKVAYTDVENPIIGTIASSLEPDIIVVRNQYSNKGVSIIKNSHSEVAKSIDIDELAPTFEVEFRHPSGFMKVVVSDSVEEVVENLFRK